MCVIHVGVCIWRGRNFLHNLKFLKSLLAFHSIIARAELRTGRATAPFGFRVCERGSGKGDCSQSNLRTLQGSSWRAATMGRAATSCGKLKDTGMTAAARTMHGAKLSVNTQPTPSQLALPSYLNPFPPFNYIQQNLRRSNLHML